MRQIKFLIALLVIVVLPSCALQPQVTKINTISEISIPEPIFYTDVDFEIIDGRYTLTTEQYDNLATTIKDIERYIIQNEIIKKEHNKLHRMESNKDE